MQRKASTMDHAVRRQTGSFAPGAVALQVAGLTFLACSGLAIVLFEIALPGLLSGFMTLLSALLLRGSVFRAHILVSRLPGIRFWR